jgi:hypothetical protein
VAVVSVAEALRKPPEALQRLTGLMCGADVSIWIQLLPPSGQAWRDATAELTTPDTIVRDGGQRIAPLPEMVF